MAEGVIGKADLKKLVAAVGKSARFFGPVRRSEGVVLAEVAPDSAMDFDYVTLKLPLKRHFFPRSELLYTYGEGEVREAPLPEDQTVVFGPRPCDARALGYLDKVFLGEPCADPYYARRRENATVVALACNAPGATCFCTSVGSGPAAKDGVDVLATDLGEALVFEPVSKKGEAFMKAHGSLFAKPKPEQLKARDGLAKGAAAAVPGLEVEGLAGKLREGCESEVWARITERCLGCGVCTQLCPTCHCFGIYDEKQGGRGRCVRVQDACMFPGFTMEASGHNPRGQRGQRMRQRVMHKFCYAPENYGEFFCVGCGRCITGCPANMDVRETVARFAGK